jgi:tetratricopeptide (TPR) repeat protein
LKRGKSKAPLLPKVPLSRAIRFSVVTVVAIAFAYLAFALAVSGITRTRAPAQALALVPFEASALAGRADELFFANPANPAAAAARLAREAVRLQAINAKALRLLGYQADALGRPERAEKLVRMAARLTRREPGAQLWLIESSARRGDDRETLMHYDIVLRTKPDTQSILFPRLLAAIDDPEIRSALKPYIIRGASWAEAFLFHANSNSKNLPALVDLITETGGLPDGNAARQQEKGLLSRLVDEKQFAAARRLYLAMAGSKPRHLIDAGLAASDRDGRFGPIGWQLFDDADAGGGFLGKGETAGIGLSIFANAATTRTIARRLLYLEPGTYRLTANILRTRTSPNSAIRWQVQCAAGDQRRVATIESEASNASGVFTIPDGCNAQFLYLIAAGGTGREGLEADITKVAIAKAAR